MDSKTGYYSEHYTVPRAGAGDGDADSDYTSSASSSSSSDSEDSEYLAAVHAEQEWEENVRQLQLAVTVLILPTVGRWLGRKWSYWLYARYIQVGWKWTLFLPERWLARA